MKQRWIFKRRKTELSKRGVYEPVLREEDVVREIQARLQYAGIQTVRARERIPATECVFCHKRTPVKGKKSDIGIPDLFGVIPPAVWDKHLGKDPSWYNSALPFFIEVKRPKGGVHRLGQIAFIEDMKRRGVPAFFANSWDVVRSEFLKLGIKLQAG